MEIMIKGRIFLSGKLNVHHAERLERQSCSAMEKARGWKLIKIEQDKVLKSGDGYYYLFDEYYKENK
jgi:hypothetical protein